MDLGLTGKIALVLGSTSGLGAATARRLAHEGARVVVTGRRGDVAAALAEEWGGGGVGFDVDLTQDGAVDQLLARVSREVGPVDVLVLNSPGPSPSAAAELGLSDIEGAVSTLLLRQVELVQGVLPGMRDRGWGRIVGIGSSGVQSPLPRLALSNIGRAGLAAYLKSLSHDVAADGVTVNMVLPGRITTARLAGVDAATAERDGIPVEDVAKRSTAAIPMGRYGQPEEFGDAVAFVCSERASYITGEQLRVDGGLVAAY